MKYSLSSVTARITRFARTDTYDEADAKLSSLLIKGSAGSFALKVISTGFAFFISIFLARLLGAEGYGSYAYVMAWVGLLSVPAVLGLDKLLVREIAAYQTQSAWGLMRGLLRRATQTVLVVSLGLALLAALISWRLLDRPGSEMLLSFWVALTMLPLLTLNSLRQAALRGLNRVVISQLPEMVIQPMVFFSLIGASYFFLGKSLTASWALGMNVVAVGVAFVVGTRLLYRSLPISVKKTSPGYKMRMWARSSLPLLFIAGMQVINARTDTIMLGAITGAKAVGIYTVANRGAGLITFILLAVNAALAPTVASLYAAKDMERLQRVITRSTRIILLFSLPIGIILILFGYWFLLLFGQDFTTGKTTLAILCVGQLVNAAMGSVSLLLVMTGYERDAAIGVGISALLNIIMNAILIPLWGIEGAATATSSSMIIWNILLAIWVYKRLGIHSTALGRIDFGR